MLQQDEVVPVLRIPELEAALQWGGLTRAEQKWRINSLLALGVYAPEFLLVSY